MAAAIAKYTGREDYGELSRALRDPNPATRARALYELGKQGEQGAEAMGNHEKAFEMLSDPSVQVQVAAITALGYMGRMGATYSDFLAQKLRGKEAESREVRRAAVRALGALGELASAQSAAIEECLDDTDVDVQSGACVALGAVRAASSADRLVEKLRSGDVEVIVAACKGLGYLATGTADLAKLLDHQEARIRAAAVASLARDPLSAEQHLGKVAGLVGDSDAHVRIGAVNIISGLGERAAAQAPALGKLLSKEDPGVRAAAAAALGGIGEAAASEIPLLEKLLEQREEDKSTLVLTVAGQQAKVSPSFRKPACAAAASLAVMGKSAHKSAPKIADGLDSFDEELRVQCACALAGLEGAGAKFEDKVLSLLDDPQPMVVAAACYSLGSMCEATKQPTPSIANKVAERIKDKHPAVRGAAVQGLGKMGEEANAHIEDIVKCFTDACGYVRSQAAGAITGCGELGQMFAGEVCRLMFDQETRVRIAAVGALPKLGQRGAAFAEDAFWLLEDATPEVRIATVKALGQFSGLDNEYLPALQNLADADPSEEVRKVAGEVVTAMRAIEDNPATAE